MREIKEMIESAITARDAREMLRLWYGCGKISQAQLEKATKLVVKNFC
jgi:hypothetical protein